MATSEAIYSSPIYNKKNEIREKRLLSKIAKTAKAIALLFRKVENFKFLRK
ncbi:hypothetical protein T09_12931 [Trichinella sp. T9]|nr:hypothetical protein T09_12931 [Trichinella sp. T9]